MYMCVYVYMYAELQILKKDVAMSLMNNCLVAIGSWSFLVAPTFQMRSCIGRSDLGRGASGMW